ncbi:hypothetical protein HanRHA438_Chr11g0512331 [Helianthus annuus]|nr:hypothetical protein HanIR_Chr11g0537871 [Helianthus annuus]KAJ0871434.1 hypothetical protein HanRHA438_Chr11g0512331 [Helianthus annuus]
MCHTSLCKLHIVPSSHQGYTASRICNTFKSQNKSHNNNNRKPHSIIELNGSTNVKKVKRVHGNAIRSEPSSCSLILKPTKVVLGSNILELGVILESMNNTFVFNCMSTLNVIMIREK